MGLLLTLTLIRKGNIQTVLVKGSVGVKILASGDGEYDKAWADGRV